MKNDEYFMNLAIKEAELALREGVLPVGSVVVMGTQVVGKAHRSKTGNIRLDHAEMKALQKALDNSYKSAPTMTIYNTLEPCMMCLGALLGSRIGRLVYALEDPYGGAMHLLSSQLSPRYQIDQPTITKGVLREEVRELLQKFFRSTNESFWQNRQNPLVQICLA